MIIIIIITTTTTNKQRRRVLAVETSCPWMDNRTAKDKEKTTKYAALPLPPPLEKCIHVTIRVLLGVIQGKET